MKLRGIEWRCWSLVLFAAWNAVAGELDVAREALRDGLWQVARAHAVKVEGDEAKLIILESYAEENRWDDVRAELTRWKELPDTPAFRYYRAVVDGRLEEAVNCLRMSGSLVGAAEAKMMEAELMVRRADRQAARELWGEVLKMTNVSERAYALASVNLTDVAAMRNAYARTIAMPLKRLVGLRLGMALAGAVETEEEGVRLVRRIVADSPDAEGARTALLTLATIAASRGKWNEADKTYSDAIEIWPDLSRDADVQAGRGEALRRLGRREEALTAFVRSEELAKDDARRASAVLKQGDVLSDLGRGTEAMARYRTVLEKYPETATAVTLRRLVSLRERETRGRDLFRAYRFDEARIVFEEIATADPERKQRMDFLEVLCMYGLGQDRAARAKAEELVKQSEDPSIAAEAKLWLAKYAYNAGEWRKAATLFVEYADFLPTGPLAPEALLWAAKAALATNDLTLAITLASRLVDGYPETVPAIQVLLVQAEALIDQARFGEAVLVLERVTISDKASREMGIQARILKADAFFAMGADNAKRYESALEAYRAVLFMEGVDTGLRLTVAFKIGRTLEKLRRNEDAVDTYYTQVVLAFREGRRRGDHFDDKARAVFSRAAFRLADDFEGRGRDRQAIDVLRLVVESGVPAAKEASERIQRISNKGLFQ